MKTRPSLSLAPGDHQQPRHLRDLLAKARLHERAEQRILKAIPETLANGVRFVNYHEGELVLQCDNATQASQIRYQQRDIMAKLRKDETFAFVWKLNIKVQPRHYTLKKPAEPMRLSKENARLLQEEAGHTKDKALREVLEKLASHASDRPD